MKTYSLTAALGLAGTIIALGEEPKWQVVETLPAINPGHSETNSADPESVLYHLPKYRIYQSITNGFYGLFAIYDNRQLVLLPARHPAERDLQFTNWWSPSLECVRYSRTNWATADAGSIRTFDWITQKEKARQADMLQLRAPMWCKFIE